MIQPGEYWRIIEDLMKWCWIGLTGGSKTASQPVAAAAWHPEVGRSYQGVRVMHGVAKVIPGWCRRCIRPDLSRVFSQTKVTFQNGPTHQHIIGPGMLWVTGQDVLEAAFFLLAVRSLGKCRLMRGGKMGLGLSNGYDAIAFWSRGCLMDSSNTAACPWLEPRPFHQSKSTCTMPGQWQDSYLERLRSPKRLYYTSWILGWSDDLNAGRDGS